MMSVEGGRKPSLTSSEQTTTPPLQLPVIGLSFGEIDPLKTRGNTITPPLIGKGSIDDIMMQRSGSRGIKEDLGKPNGNRVTVFEFPSGEGN